MNQCLTTHGMLAATVTESIGLLMQIEDFSSFDRLISVTTRVVMFCRRLMRTLQLKQPHLTRMIVSRLNPFGSSTHN